MTLHALALVITALFALNSWSRSTPISENDIESLRLLGHNNLPIKVLVYREDEGNEYVYDNNMQFVSDLSNIIVEINETEKLPYREEIKLFLADSTDDTELNKIDLDDVLKGHYIQRVPFYGDRWFQDFGEIMVAKTKSDSEEKLLIFDGNRGRGLEKLAPTLSKFWNSYYFKIKDRQNAGNYGGNIEVTPNNVLAIGTTSTQKLRKFFADGGYKNDMAVLNTDWLAVGHVDEFSSTIILDENDPCGFAVVKASPLLALDLLKNAKDEDFLSIPKKYSFYKYSEHLKNMRAFLNGKETEDTDAKSMAEAQKTIAGLIDNNIKNLLYEIKEKTPSCENIEVVTVPILFQCDEYGSNPEECISFLPDSVNMLVLRNHTVVPDPFFTPFKKSIERAYGEKGQKIHFIDTMFYHTTMGQIHCGTNVFRLPNEYLNSRI